MDLYSDNFSVKTTVDNTFHLGNPFTIMYLQIIEPLSIKLSPDSSDVLYLAHCAKVLGTLQPWDKYSHYLDNI